MKNPRILLTGLLLCSALIAANATGSAKLSMKYAVNLFIDAFAHGQFKDFEAILDPNVKLTMNRGSGIDTYNKRQILQMLEGLRNVDQNCITSASIVENMPGQVIIKVNMKYSSFARVNYISMSENCRGWRINNISSVFTV